MECYCAKKKELLTPATPWMNLKARHSVREAIHETTYCMILFLLKCESVQFA